MRVEDNKGYLNLFKCVCGGEGVLGEWVACGEYDMPAIETKDRMEERSEEDQKYYC